MARIRTLTRSSQSISVHKTEVDATFQTVMNSDGKLYFHMSTYGSDNRASEPKVSQTIQLDEETASLLVAELARTFGHRILEVS
jgi:hypothetical protein